MGCLATAQRPSVFWFGPRIRWSSAFRLFRAADMLKHELQRLSFVKEKPLEGKGRTGNSAIAIKHRSSAALMPLSQLDSFWKLRAKLRSSYQLIRAGNIEAHGARLRTGPDFLGAGVKVKRHFLLDFCFSVAR